MSDIGLKELYTILHILGAVLGAGGAFMSDFMFFSSVKDGKINRTEFRFLKLGSTMTWIGLMVLIVSGVLLFGLEPVYYLASSKFLVKMTIVFIILVNGLFFHYMHIPRIAKHRDVPLSGSMEFMKKSPSLAASGAISMVSWLAALVLGSLHSIPYSFVVGMVGYLAVLAVAIAIAIAFRHKMLSG